MRLLFILLIVKHTCSFNKGQFSPPSTFLKTHFSTNEQSIIETLTMQHEKSPDSLADYLTSNPSTANLLTPQFLSKLKQSSSLKPSITSILATLQSVSTKKYDRAKSTLTKLLSSNEIKKMDANIGLASRNSELDLAFFTVLNVNIEAASKQEGVTDAEKTAAAVTTRLQILLHLQTRCYEELEKSIKMGGEALLVKLLRMEDTQIRANLLRHNLAPVRSVTTPDGGVLDLGEKGAMVPSGEFVKAIEKTVKNVRKMRNDEVVEKIAAVNMIEDCRQIAMEARIVIFEAYGEESEELISYQNFLQPIFRPNTEADA